jgi:hypothetical protein
LQVIQNRPRNLRRADFFHHFQIKQCQ